MGKRLTDSVNGKGALAAILLLGIIVASAPNTAIAGMFGLPPSSAPAEIEPSIQLGNTTILTALINAAKQIVGSAPAEIGLNQTAPLPIQIGTLNRTVTYKVGNQSFSASPADVPTLTGNKFIALINGYYIANTRALHEDTNTVSISVRIDNNPDPAATLTNTVYRGNENNGLYPIDLTVGPFNVNTALTISYGIVNHHADSEADIFNTVSTTSTAVAGAAFGPTGSFVTSTIASIIGYVFPGLLRGGCDGGVVADSHTYNSLDEINNLPGMAETGRHTEGKAYPGYDSNWGCGSNSNYHLTWTIAKVP